MKTFAILAAALALSACGNFDASRVNWAGVNAGARTMEAPPVVFAQPAPLYFPPPDRGVTCQRYGSYTMRCF